MRYIKWIKWMKLLLGLVMIGLFMIIIPQIYPSAILQQNRNRNIDAGALFYSESPQALQKSFRLQKLTEQP